MYMYLLLYIYVGLSKYGVPLNFIGKLNNCVKILILIIIIIIPGYTTFFSDKPIYIYIHIYIYIKHIYIYKLIHTYMGVSEGKKK